MGPELDAGRSAPEAAVTAGAVVGPVVLGPVAHGGHVVARVEGRVVFVRHGIPGEQVLLRVTDTSRPSFWRADVEQVLVASPDRVDAPCSVAARCGGCDFQHVSHAGQLRLKTAVLREQLLRLAGLDLEVEVEPVALAGDDRLAWRTRVRYHVDGGRVGLRAHRSHDLVDLPGHGCLIAAPGPTPVQLRALAERSAASIDVVSTEPPTVLLDGQLDQGAAEIVHQVLTEELRVRADGFWQVHPRAAEVLAGTVLEMLEPRSGESALDLYCGVGLFASVLAAAGVRVLGVESSPSAVALARSNVPSARFLAGPLERNLRRLGRRTNLVVLDPPRAGAGDRVVAHVSQLGARAIALVGCDPASFARDLASFARHGHDVVRVRAFDLFPMTHHLESVALLVPRTAQGAEGG